ncbi:hypothetical protein VOLCADRAFT_83997 [Volvox carteri f. nagariensis]|uniref:Ubiquitin carboxyl-terminal hydrolase n=1 Tax=Volvox carteri f. nagariensis TaxID=3068 RepID=D8UF04_VOLCA|nr:uncharacterized protein VOLCADRAFT_83997 [Volvox carteri f. nagariensis]EFJ41731.1 hypothetical protein VOLCADRAFT_83997 [Volvox carteri f. nagariensis]|eukprot:XP_002957233.1 hypothetical protein VOLCADRAFT_83997 [Volvox carteri f. nagariensis]
MSNAKKWVPLESNPDVLNEFVSKLGLDVSEHSFSDVFGLDEELLEMVPKPVIAVILCYPVTSESDALAKKEDEEQAAKGMPVDAKLFYMKQTIGNACGTIAVLHSIGNNLSTMDPADGSFLQQFFSATSGMSAAEAGKYLEEPPSGAPSIEEAHQAAAAAGDTAPPSADEDVDLHFVAFVHKDGQLWELDGRRAGPVCRGPSSSETLLQDAARVVQDFISRSSSLTFNVLALTATAGGGA